ncbi:hypothetical protein [Treponema sp. UBA3813]|uniref:hypothetical protein n=1 Tax=Treponema sp. UBA3813 TaxID=1947715 RepID=UPI0025F9C23B|nr:hypothetical protein [Treponema sp. UBA3813]
MTKILSLSGLTRQSANHLRQKIEILLRKRSPAPRTNLGHVSTENLKDAFSGRIIDRETEFLELSKKRRLEIDNEEIKEDYLKRILK